MKILERELNKEKTKDNYRKIAWFYNFWSWFTESKAAKMVLELANIRDNQKILEIACGTGVVFEKIVRQNKNGYSVGIDLSPGMLEKARKRLRKFRDANYKLEEGNVLDLDFEDNFFDILINNFMIDLMPEETFTKIASEFYRILKPDGIAVISTFSFGKKRINRSWYWIAKKFPDLLTGCRPVSFKGNLTEAGFDILDEIELSQNTFPSQVVKVKK